MGKERDMIRKLKLDGYSRNEGPVGRQGMVCHAKVFELQPEAMGYH